jgi:hypothetical protein
MQFGLVGRAENTSVKIKLGMADMEDDLFFKTEEIKVEQQ